MEVALDQVLASFFERGGMRAFYATLSKKKCSCHWRDGNTAIDYAVR
jgi:hypothetical protein